MFLTRDWCRYVSSSPCTVSCPSKGTRRSWSQCVLLSSLNLSVTLRAGEALASSLVSYVARAPTHTASHTSTPDLSPALHLPSPSRAIGILELLPSLCSSQKSCCRRPRTVFLGNNPCTASDITFELLLRGHYFIFSLFYILEKDGGNFFWQCS